MHARDGRSSDRLDRIKDIGMQGSISRKCMGEVLAQVNSLAKTRDSPASPQENLTAYGVVNTPTALVV